VTLFSLSGQSLYAVKEKATFPALPMGRLSPGVEQILNMLSATYCVWNQMVHQERGHLPRVTARRLVKCWCVVLPYILCFAIILSSGKAIPDWMAEKSQAVACGHYAVRKDC
jgi:hypothetical protein